MAKYFHISSGLRGCYMPDSAHVVRVDTRKELKAIIEFEANSWRDDGAAGLSKKAISAFAAVAWREAQKKKPAYLPHCLPIKPHGARDYSSGIFVSVATRDEYKEYSESID